MRKSKLWTLAMALAASLGGPLDADAGEWGNAVREDGQKLSSGPDARGIQGREGEFHGGVSGAVRNTGSDPARD